MQINYIILAHKNPLQLACLINQLNDTDCHFYIHIDKAVQQESFKILFKGKSNVHFISEPYREYGTWGDIGIVKATIHAMKEISKTNCKGYCVLLSGQDYPLQNNTFIKSYFQDHYGINFITTFSIPINEGWGTDGGLNRLHQYKINLSNTRHDFIQLPCVFEKSLYSKKNVLKIFKLLKNNKFFSLLKIFKKRQCRYKLQPYGGSQWWALPFETVKEIIQFINEHPKYTDYHKYTLLPDEIYFQSIIMHLNKANPLSTIKKSVTYVNWERKNTSLPVTFKNDDFEELKKASLNNFLFARKFDLDIDEEIIKTINTNLLNNT